LRSWKKADLSRRQPGSLNISRDRQVRMQGLAFDSPGSGSSIPLFSRTEKTKSHPILAVQQLPIPYSLVPIPCFLTNHSQKKTPNIRLNMHRSPSIREESKFFNDVFAAILIKVDSYRAPVQAKPDSYRSPLSPKPVTNSCSFWG
jgi:hypothetical protein